MRFNFDEIIDRKGTNSIKYEAGRQNPNLPEDAIPLWIADMDFATPDPILEAMHNRLSRRILGYSDLYDPAYRKAVTGWYRRRFDWEVDPDTIVAYPGVVAAINAAVATLTAPREGVILMTPCYGPFDRAVRVYGRTPVYTRMLNHDGYYTVDFQDLEEKARMPKNTLLFLCSPHNPTGRVFSAMELARIGEICFRNNVFVVADEIHADLIRGGVEHIPFAKLFPNEKRLLTCTAPTKTFNMAGCHLSNIVIPDEQVREVMGQGIFTNLPNPLAIDGVIAAYNKCEGWLEEVKNYLDDSFLYMRDFIMKNMHPARFRIPEGTYLAWVDLRGYGYTDEELKRRLEASGLFVEYASDFVDNGLGHIRINIACPRRVLEEALARLAAALD